VGVWASEFAHALLVKFILLFMERVTLLLQS